MTLDQRGANHQMATPDKYQDPDGGLTGIYQMNTWDYVLRPTVDAAAIIVILPLVHEAKGRLYSIVAGGNVTRALPVTIRDQDESQYWEGDLVLYDIAQCVTFYSDGLKWMIGPHTSVIRTTAQVVNLIRNTFVELTTTVDSAVNMIEVFKSHFRSNVQNGQWVNAIFGRVDFMTVGHVTGLCGVICAELTMPAGAIPGGRGTYACFQAEINCPDLYVGGGVPMVVMSINLWGDEHAQFDDTGILLDITGVVSGANDFWRANAVAFNNCDGFLKIRVNGTTYYIPVSDNQAGT